MTDQAHADRKRVAIATAIPWGLLGMLGLVLAVESFMFQPEPEEFSTLVPCSLQDCSVFHP